METKQVTVVTISPIYAPLELKTGINRLSEQYIAFKKQLKSPNILFLNDSVQKEYEFINHDSWDHRLFIWCDEALDPTLSIHVFPNNIAIAVVTHTLDYNDDTEALESAAQTSANFQIKQAYPGFVNAINNLKTESTQTFFEFDNTASLTPDIFWVSRTLVVNSDEVSSDVNQPLLTKWLRHTYNPDDAQNIIDGTLDCSLTWLNYVIVDLASLSDERLESMILAQYYYSAQERCNRLLKSAIDSAYNDSNDKQANKQLISSRVITRLHQVDYHEHLKYLTQTKRKRVQDILKCWDFEQLTENGQRMIEICSSKIEDTENKKREKSSLMTDLLLVALSFFTVFELSLYLTELSREMMSRPALDFNDDSRSFMLQFIAGIDTDVMFGSGFVLTLLLFFAYKIIKSR
ncbi:hypothetical protein GCM10008107_14290 [Psychrosphaera saromensis]|uniref:Uncharacterized protein n=1 Tax=Psychrosphaera saromensis TaxID=716813 RepID=A0A2S7UVQ2_9GAMM|nr:hypothetical protein [Psychrosphaera saromensis]PQJ53340.1 hypothetical protein BTO11_06430 [Psychrosphaera saromensis]GHB66265.1 hypothetical protein GCM10008107_14290 [Psychrosphaera saromensis]GLQ14885.1 hypothetical protein GCM10007917_23400 [Psychrosphaera saromensis]